MLCYLEPQELCTLRTQRMGTESTERFGYGVQNVFFVASLLCVLCQTSLTL
jgi:hypothetical protein